MAFSARAASRSILRSTPATSSFRPAARGARYALPSQAFRSSSRRGFASEAPPPQGKSSNGLLWAGVAAAGAGAYFYLKGGDASTISKDFVPAQKDYQAVYDEIARRFADETDYDDGSYGPVSYHSMDGSIKSNMDQLADNEILQ